MSFPLLGQLPLPVAEEVDAISHSAVISACEKSSEWKQSLELLGCRWMLGSAPVALVLACHGRIVKQSSSETEIHKADSAMYPNVSPPWIRIIWDHNMYPHYVSPHGSQSVLNHPMPLTWPCQLILEHRQRPRAAALRLFSGLQDQALECDLILFNSVAWRLSMCVGILRHGS